LSSGSGRNRENITSSPRQDREAEGRKPCEKVLEFEGHHDEDEEEDSSEEDT
jgi:hypothetical protein